MGVLKWKDPWQRDYTEINELYDTGFCNRVFHWELAYFINEFLYDGKFTIAVEESQWPESIELIDLPNTIVIPSKEEKSYFNKLTDVHLSKEDLINVFLKKIKLKEDTNYISAFKYIDIGVLETDNIVDKSIRPLSKIKLKNKKLQDNINELTSDLVGVHLRRSRGVKIPSKFYSDENYSDYIKFRKEQGAIEFSIFEYIHDDVYFKLLDSILDLNPNQKFYLSYDVPYKFVSHWKEKYGDKIITKDDLKKKIDLSFVENSNEMHVDNMIDLFGLSNTKYLIAYPVSTWSVFSHEYKNKKRNFIHDDFGIILSEYERL